jgi:hypothetical protein
MIARRPERRLFMAVFGEFIEDRKGVERDCFRIVIEGSPAELVSGLLRHHGSAVALARDAEGSGYFLVAASLDGVFSREEIIKIALLYAPMLRAAGSRSGSLKSRR